jgi:hypothetical protein
MSWRSLETAAWLLLYAAIIAFLLTWNSSSPIHTAVYRDGTHSDWLPGASRAYVVGSTIEGGLPAPYFAGNWWHAEGEFRWGRGARNDVVIEPATTIPAGSRIVAHLGVLPLRVLRQYWVDILVNGQKLGRFVGTDEMRRLEVELPFALPAGVPATISFETQAANSPLAEGYSSDYRELGVRLHDLTVLPPWRPADRNASDNR